ncbi:MAG: ATP-binding protein [Micromonosporaceae bacterium]|nr:ATP-binding protein [Micromonosporaceae bacterium]
MNTSPGARDVLQATFDLDQLSALRRTTSQRAQACGLAGQALDEFVLAVNEIVSNAIAHGGGAGELRMWCDGDQLRCQVRDRGPGISPGCLATPRPPLSADGGRGLWMASQFCHLDVQTGPQGTAVEISTPLQRPL